MGGFYKQMEYGRIFSNLVGVGVAAGAARAAGAAEPSDSKSDGAPDCSRPTFWLKSFIWGAAKHVSIHRVTLAGLGEKNKKWIFQHKILCQ
jgi:hypothetical protein